MIELIARYSNSFIILLTLATNAVSTGETDEPSLAIIDKLENQYYFFRQGPNEWTVYRGGNPKTYCNSHQIITNDADTIRCYAPSPDGTLNLKFKLQSPYRGSRRVACDATGLRWIGMQEFDSDLGDVRFHQFKLEKGRWIDVRPLPVHGDEYDLDYGSGQGFKLVLDSDPKAKRYLYYSAGSPRCVIESGFVNPVYHARSRFEPGIETLDCTNATDRNGRFCVFEVQYSRDTAVDNQDFTWTYRLWDTDSIDWQMHGPRVTTDTTQAATEVSILDSGSFVNKSTGYLDKDIAVFFSRAATVVWSEDGQKLNKLHVATPDYTKLLGMFELRGELFLVASDDKERRFWIAETKKEHLTKEDLIKPNWSATAFVDLVEMTLELTKSEQQSELFWLRLATFAMTLVATVSTFFIVRSIFRSSRAAKQQSAIQEPRQRV